jgi:hypothetical protein
MHLTSNTHKQPRQLALSLAETGLSVSQFSEQATLNNQTCAFSRPMANHCDSQHASYMQGKSRQINHWAAVWPRRWEPHLQRAGEQSHLKPSMRLRISCPSAGEQVAAAWQQQISVTDKTILCAGHHLPTAGCRCTQVSTACLYMFWHICLVHCMKLGMPANMIGLLGLLAGWRKCKYGVCRHVQMHTTKMQHLYL